MEIHDQGKRLVTFQPADELPVRVKQYTHRSTEEKSKKQAQPKIGYKTQGTDALQICS